MTIGDERRGPSVVVCELWGLNASSINSGQIPLASLSFPLRSIPIRFNVTFNRYKIVRYFVGSYLPAGPDSSGGPSTASPMKTSTSFSGGVKFSLVKVIDLGDLKLGREVSRLGKHVMRESVACHLHET